MDKNAKMQDAFWKGIIDKYENRNVDLEHKQHELQLRVDKLETSLPGVLAYDISKFAKDNPNTNVNDLIQLYCDQKSEEQQEEPIKLPNLRGVDTFSIDEADVECMDRIKELTDNEKKLNDDVTKLKNKEDAIIDANKKMNGMLNNEITGTPVDGNDIQDMNAKLLVENRKLNNEVSDLEKELKLTRDNIEGPIKRELDRERKKAVELENKLCEQETHGENQCKEILKQIVFYQTQLKAADKHLADLIEINTKLKDEVNILQILNEAISHV